MSVCIRIKDAVKKYGDNTIISDLSLDIKEGEFFTLLGPSGSMYAFSMHLRLSSQMYGVASE